MKKTKNLLGASSSCDGHTHFYRELVSSKERKFVKAPSGCRSRQELEEENLSLFGIFR